MTTHLSVIPRQRSEVWWLTRHQQKLAEIQHLKEPIEILFLGDSITHAWEVEGQEYWQHHFANYKTLNLGYAGDRTEHLLWRIQNGELPDISPPWIVLLIGTNNAGHRLDTPEQIADGIQAILAELQQQLASSNILLMAIFPRSRNANKPMRQRVDAANALIKNFTKHKQVHWLDINQLFLSPKGVLLESVMPDLLHLNAAQYDKWAQAILRYIDNQNQSE